MIEREEIYDLINAVECPADIIILANETRESHENPWHWRECVEKMIDKTAKRYRNPHRAVAFLGRAFKVTQSEFQQAHDSYALRRIMMGDPYVHYCSFDTMKMIMVDWLMWTIKTYGDCTPELMYLYLMSEQLGPFKPLNWLKLKLTKKI